MTGMTPVGELMVARAGSLTPGDFPDELFDLYSIPAYDRGSSEITVGESIGSAKQVVRPGDVLLSKIVPHIRRAWVVGPNRGHRMIASGEWIVFRDDRVNVSYLRHVLLGDPFHVQFMNTVAGVGGSLLRARPAFVAKIEVPIPPLEEQRRMASILDQTDTLRAKRREALAHLDDLTQSIFLDMFGDPVTNPRKWDVVLLADLLSRPLRNGVSPATRGTVDSRVLTLSAVTGQAFRSDAHKQGPFERQPSPAQCVSASDLLICRGNGNIKLVGRGFFPTRDMPNTAFPDTIIAAAVDVALVSRGFLQHLWNSASVRQQIESVARTTNGTFKVNQTMLENVSLLSPAGARQKEFSERVSEIDRLKETHSDQLVQLEKLFASLQSRAFSGEL